LSRFLFLALLACVPWAGAQSYSRQEVGVGASAVSNTPITWTADGPVSSYHVFAGPLARYTWNLSPSLALEGDVSFHFANRNYFSGANDGDLLVAGGMKAGWRGKRFGVFEEFKPGVTWYHNGIEEVYPVVKYFDVGYFTLQQGAVLEYYPSRRLIWRLDAGQRLLAQFDHTTLDTSTLRVYSAGAVPTHLSLSVDASYRLGELREEDESVPRKGAADLGIFFPLQIREHMQNQDLRPDRGLGGWFSVPASRYLSLDAAGFRLPQDDRTYYAQDGGPATEIFGGLKAGIRRDRMGYFAKVQPGVVRFDHGLADLDQTGPSTFVIHRRPIDNFAWDTGGVFEVYPSSHTVLRVDAGNVFIHYHAETITAPTGILYYPPVRKSSILFAFGAGWRF
jgi:hypothetical protein